MPIESINAVFHPTLRGDGVRLPRQAWGWSAAILLACCAGCRGRPDAEVTVYVALDAEFSQPILREFERQNGIVVAAKFDTEATKTVSLAEAIRAERRRPRCDVFWNNEILHVLRLEREGLIEAYVPARAEQYPAQYRSPDGAWHGLAARARVLLVNSEKIPADQAPRSIEALVDDRWQGDVAIARPFFGTTATHAACLFAVWGDERAEDFFRRLRRNALVMGGNKQVALAVGAGQVAFGLTDTDDAVAEIEKGMPVKIIYPDQEPGGLGTLFIPNTLAIIKGSPHPQSARRLVDFLLSSEVEDRLARGPSAQIPLYRGAAKPERVETPATVRAMQVDFAAAERRWTETARFLQSVYAAD